MRLERPSLGLLGRIVAIILLTVSVEFAASTVLFERASGFSVREDEARRLAEHLIVSRKLVGQRPWRERPAMADYVTTDRYTIEWQTSAPPSQPLSAELRTMRQQVVEWEPELADTNLRLRLASPGRHDIVLGDLRLSDGTWLLFRMSGLGSNLGLKLNWLLLALVPALALTMVGILLIRLTLRPLDALSAAAKRIGQGEQLMIEEAGTREVRGLIRAFNQMQERIHRMIGERTEALAAVGHDLRTPLARLQLRTEAIEDPALRSAAERDIEEMTTMIESVLAYLAGDDDPEAPVAVDIAILVATIADDCADRGHDVVYVGPSHLEAILRPNSFTRAVVNLVDNAIHHGDHVVITVADGDDTVTVSVEDDGPGIPDEFLEAVLKPFIRLDTARSRNTRGLGLGLPIVARMVQLENGLLTLSNRNDGGLRAEIRLPMQK